MERIKESKDRERSIVKSERILYRKMGVFQKELTELTLDLLLDRIRFDDGKAVATGANFNTINSLGSVYDIFIKQNSDDIVAQLIEGIKSIHRHNEAYFSRVIGKSVKTDSLKIFNILLGRLGITQDNKIKPGGYIDSVLNTGDAIAELKNEALRAIISGQSLAGFKKAIKNKIQGSPSSPGILEQHYNRHLYDLWQQYDREAGRQFAEKLDLKYAIYQGGLIKTSRPFCKVRNNLVFTAEEISKFGTPNDPFGGYSDKATGDFQGKNDNYSPFLDLGGYNCRHQLDWVSNELGEYLYNNQQTGNIAPVDIVPNEYGHIQRDIEDFESEIFDLNHERGGFYNRDGVLQDITDGEARKITLKHYLDMDTEGGVFTHNHPSWKTDPTRRGNSLSKPDIFTSINFGLKEIRAVTGASVYTMKFDETFEIGRKVIIRGLATQADMSEVERVVRTLEIRVRNRLQGKLNSGDITESEASLMHYHLLWQEFEKFTKGVSYARQKRQKD